MTLIAVGQLCSTTNLLNNGKVAAKLLKQAADIGAKVLFLPEASDYIARSAAESVAICQSVDKSEFLAPLKEALASISPERRPYISVGVHEPADKRVKNTLLWIDPNGNIVHRYQKLHLFDVDMPNGAIVRESDSVEPGNELLKPFSSPIGLIGSAICYDIRFPEMALKLRELGAQVLLYPSAFTLRTGAAHWMALGKARALDTQSYVIMAAQSGKHDEEGKRISYGHSMVVDPWGTVIAEAPDVPGSTETILLANIDLDVVQEVRQTMPLEKQRRKDVV